MSATLDNSPKYVGFFWRAIALSLDYVFLIALQIPLEVLNIKFENSDILTLAYLFAFLAYFWLLPKIGKATMGQYLMGYRIVPAAEGRPQYAWRLAYVFGTVIMWSFFLFYWLMLRKEDVGIYWWDRKSNTRAEKTRD